MFDETQELIMLLVSQNGRRSCDAAVWFRIVDLDNRIRPYRLELRIMANKIIIIADPGIDTAFAVALALHDPNIDVVGLIGSAGNVSADQATQNIHILINQIDAPKWPRVGAALPVTYDVDGTRLHGPDGLGGVSFPPISLHQPMAGDKLIVELVRANPKEITVVVLGPATMLARALDRDPELPNMIDRIILLGGSWHEPGNASAVAEFHFFLDPQAVRQVLRCGANITILPLDVTRKLVFFANRPARTAVPGFAGVPFPQANRPLRHPRHVQPLRDRGLSFEGRSRHRVFGAQGRDPDRSALCRYRDSRRTDQGNERRRHTAASQWRQERALGGQRG